MADWMNEVEEVAKRRNERGEGEEKNSVHRRVGVRLVEEVAAAVVVASVVDSCSPPSELLSPLPDSSHPHS